MARGAHERQPGKRRLTNRVDAFAGQLVSLRVTLEGMDGSDPDFAATLAQAEITAADLSSASVRMDKDGVSRRTACERLITAQLMRVEFN